MKRLTCPRGAVLDLAAAKLPPDEAALLARHVTQCAPCARALREAETLAHAAKTLSNSQVASGAVADEVRDRLWAALAPVADDAAERARTRAAVRHLARSRYGALAALAVVLVAAGALWSGHALWFGRALHHEPPRLAAHPAPPPITRLKTLAVQPRTPPMPAPPPPLAAPPTPQHAPRSNVLHLACGAAIHRADADLRVVKDELGHGVVRLASGAVQVEVPKLPAGARMAVETAEAQVAVKGTRFSVRRDAAGTAISVSDGTVWVTPVGKGRPLEVLAAGQTTLVAPLDGYRKTLRQSLQTALGAQAWPEVAQAARKLLDTLDDGTEADALRLELAAVAKRTGDVAQAVALAEAVAQHGVLELTRQNALVFEANLHRAGEDRDAEAAVWRRYRGSYPNGAHGRQALERLVDLTCGETSATADGYRQQLQGLAGADGLVLGLLKRCEPDPR